MERMFAHCRSSGESWSDTCCNSLRASAYFSPDRVRRNWAISLAMTGWVLPAAICSFAVTVLFRSEERRVGEEVRSRRAPSPKIASTLETPVRQEAKKHGNSQHA